MGGLDFSPLFNHLYSERGCFPSIFSIGKIDDDDEFRFAKMTIGDLIRLKGGAGKPNMIKLFRRVKTDSLHNFCGTRFSDDLILKFSVVGHDARILGEGADGNGSRPPSRSRYDLLRSCEEEGSHFGGEGDDPLDFGMKGGDFGFFPLLVPGSKEGKINAEKSKRVLEGKVEGVELEGAIGGLAGDHLNESGAIDCSSVDEGGEHEGCLERSDC